MSQALWVTFYICCVLKGSGVWLQSQAASAAMSFETRKHTCSHVLSHTNIHKAIMHICRPGVFVLWPINQQGGHTGEGALVNADGRAGGYRETHTHSNDALCRPHVTSGDLGLPFQSNLTLKCPPFCLAPGKDHVCRFVGCGRNDRFNYVVMELQVGVNADESGIHNHF